MMPETTTIGRGISEEMEKITETGGRFISSTVGTAEERNTGEANDRIRGQEERKDSGEEIGVIAETIGIHPTPNAPRTDIGTGRTGT